MVSSENQRQAARDELIQDHLGYVKALAAQVKKALSSQLDFDELVAYGSQGLVEAAERFDPTRGVSFTTFAYYRIRGAIFDGLRQTGWLSRTEYGRFTAAAHDYLTHQSDRPSSPGPTSPTKGEVLAEVASTLDDLTAIFLTSLNSDPRGEVPDREKPDASQELEAKQMQRELKKALNCLPEKERQLIDLYYFTGLNLQEAGRQLGLSKSWASRLHARAIRLLAQELAYLSE